jgi:two-component system phosphate regulon response regulator PhoB
MTRKALIVDDQSDIRKLIHMTLEFEDFELHEADNGAEGWRVAQGLRPSLVLLDVMMPGELDGYQVCTQLRADPDHATLPIVMLTARAQESDRRAGERAGASEYLSKPFSPMVLADTVSRLLEARQRAPAQSAG